MGSEHTSDDLTTLHLDLALGQVRVRGQPLPQGDVRVRGDSEGLLQLGQLRSAEDGPLPLPLALGGGGGGGG